MSKAKFEIAVEIVRSLPKEGAIQPSQDDKLYVRQFIPIMDTPATEGDVVDGTRPGILDFVGKAKWFEDAWKGVKGTSKEDAYSKYVEKLLEILKSVNDEESKKHIAAIENA
ncbi:hypothetical protein DXG01_007156 [Tephrocybe rancida]|nr:hypothetical protein DXG01_007156 [Tephrocybe rancida]